MTELRTRPSPRRLAAALAVVASVALAQGAAAQMPGLPVLQNAFANPGITLAADYGGDTQSRAYGGALAWSPGTGRFVFSAGAGVFAPDEGDSGTSFGGRGAASLFSLAGGSIGVSGFAGAGGASVGDTRLLQVPAGLAFGWRHSLGATRGISIHAAPFYSWSRASVQDGETRSRGLVRFSVGADVTLLRKLGATVGVEGGITAKASEPGPRGTSWGIALSYALR